MLLVSNYVSPNQLKTTLMPRQLFHGDACFAYFNKIWGIPETPRVADRVRDSARLLPRFTRELTIDSVAIGVSPAWSVADISASRIP